MRNKLIAKHILGFIGGVPKVERFYNTDESKSIDIISSNSGKLKNISTSATIGVSDVNIGLVVGKKSLRVELIAAGMLENEILGNILANIAFNIFDSKNCFYGMVFKDIINNYLSDTDMRHCVLMSPIFWDNYSSYEDKDIITTWLMLIPISDTEKEYIEDNGIDSFDKLLSEKDIDVLDYFRHSIL